MTTRTFDQVCQRIAERDKRFRYIPEWLKREGVLVEGFKNNVTLDTLAQYAPFADSFHMKDWFVEYSPEDDSQECPYGTGPTLLDAWARAYLAKLEQKEQDAL